LETVAQAADLAHRAVALRDAQHLFGAQAIPLPAMS
jgi:hypothetical protein